jgi:diguanylate cyclase (GGDEF)-like protein
MFVLQLQNIILEMVARGDDLKATSDRLCVEIEAMMPDIVCSVLKVDRSGLIHPLSGPSLPAAYSAALDGVAIGPQVGSCGTAAYLRVPVTVTDIETDHRWTDFKALALPLGFRACWSSPICDGAGDVLGTFAFYFRESRGPTAEEQAVVATCVNLCAIALERYERVEERERQANVDALTGLGNRACFNRALAALPCTEPGAWGLLIVDLDNLKVVNDTFGHHVGDMLLREVAARIATASMPDRAFRLGGDEFAVILQNEDALNNLEAMADGILGAIGACADCSGHLVYPRATIGGALLSHDDHVAESVRQNADFALYHAKETGRGGFVRFWPGIGTAITQRLSAIRRVSAGLADDRIDAYYQPLVRLDTQEIIGVEALCRLTSETGEIIPASAFSEAMTDAHAALGITERMLGRIVSDIRFWLDHDIAFGHVGINVSSSDFHSGKLAEQLIETFSRQNIPLEYLMVEVTEDVCVGPRDLVVANQIRAMRAQGLRVALDDFGTGFASLTHLLTFPVDMIKIDKSFIDRLAPEDPSSAIVRGVLDIARKMDIAVIAEGIETEAQARQLQRLGATFGQGYLFSPAVDRTNLTAMFRAGPQAPSIRVAS